MCQVNVVGGRKTISSCCEGLVYLYLSEWKGKITDMESKKVENYRVTSLEEIQQKIGFVRNWIKTKRQFFL